MNARDITPEQALDKLMAYCSKMERSEFDVRQKLYQWGITGEATKPIIEKLNDEGFLNQQRYLTSYIRGKYNYKKWGRVKIRHSLSMRGFKDAAIDKAFDAFFPTVDYEQMIFDQLQRKNQSLDTDDDYQRKSKLILFGQTRGYETDISLACADRIIKSSKE